MKEYRIRREEEKDYQKTETVVREAFWNVYRPGCLEHFVLHELRRDKDFIPELNFVMEIDGEIAGQVVCVKAVIDTDEGKQLPIMTLGPICIAPAYKRQGYGRILLDYVLAEAEKLGYGAVCFEGNIAFYGGSGFTYASEFNLRYHGLPEGADSSFFLCKELKKGYLSGVSGEYSTPQGYFVDEGQAEEFDKAFPPKKKEKREGQLF